MAIPTRGLNDIRTLSGRVDQLSMPYRSYMQITCLEMEKARRNSERKSASQRIAIIDARLEQIEKAKRDLLQVVSASGPKAPPRLTGLELRPTRGRSGFRIRY